MGRFTSLPTWLELVIGASAAYALAHLGGVAIRPLTPEEGQRVAQLVPSVQAALAKLVASLASAGVQVYVGQTYASAAAQDNAYRTGRSATTKGWHVTGRAVDLEVIDPRTGARDLDVKRPDLYSVMGTIARSQGWRWLGLGEIKNPTTGATFTDPYHLEFREGLTWEQAVGRT